MRTWVDRLLRRPSAEDKFYVAPRAPQSVPETEADRDKSMQRRLQQSLAQMTDGPLKRETQRCLDALTEKIEKP